MEIVRSGALLLLVCAVSAFSQSTQTSTQTPATPKTNTAPSSAQKSTAKTHARNTEPPCWRQAGLTAAMVNQRWKLQDTGKTKIAEVCSEASSSPQQKHDKIEQINAQTDQAIAKLIPEKQLQAFNACQAALDKKHPKPAGQKELGPCGGTIPASGMDMSTHDHH